MVGQLAHRLVRFIGACLYGWLVGAFTGYVDWRMVAWLVSWRIDWVRWLAQGWLHGCTIGSVRCRMD